MQSLALRLYGENDLRLERFDLPEITDDEILADIITNSICMSDYKATIKVPDTNAFLKTLQKNPSSWDTNLRQHLEGRQELAT